MSDKFYEATQVIMDGRLSRMFTGTRVKGASTKKRCDQDPRIIDAVVQGSRLGKHPKQIASELDISYSSVMTVKNLFRSRWEGVAKEATSCRN